MLKLCLLAPPPSQFNISILHKIIELYKIFYQYLELFPKRQKFGVGQKCENIIIEILESIIIALQIPKNNKLPYLEKASIKLNVLKIFFRLTTEFKIIDNKKYVNLEIYCQEIGKMLGGWIKSVKY